MRGIHAGNQHENVAVPIEHNAKNLGLHLLEQGVGSRFQNSLELGFVQRLVVDIQLAGNHIGDALFNGVENPLQSASHQRGIQSAPRRQIAQDLYQGFPPRGSLRNGRFVREDNFLATRMDGG